MGPKSVKKARDLRARLADPEYQAERNRDLWRSLTRTEHTEGGGEFDLELICADNKRVLCHQFVLATASRFLSDLIKTNCAVMLDSSLRSVGLLVISLPDVGGWMSEESSQCSTTASRSSLMESPVWATK